MEYEKLSVRTKAGLIKTVGALAPISAEKLLEKELEMPEEIVKGTDAWHIIRGESTDDRI